jgi:hypothetical protein
MQSSRAIHMELPWKRLVKNREVGNAIFLDRDIGLLIADGVYNRLKSTNIRECVRIARLARNDPTQVNRIVET